ncbi:MAG: LysR family transcriptional regulator [Proteobacteria bacterium]|nr:LysR family transcriptional regulator [Pseudomonadota bacterium]
MNLRLVDLNLLVVFDALMSERHVTRAAHKINISQPAMSNALRRLRELFADELLVRTPTGMEPTPRALELIQPTQQALREVTRVFDNDVTFDPRRSDHAFRLRMGDIHGWMIMPGVMERLGQEAPGIGFDTIHLQPSATVAALETDEVDLAISTGLQHSTTIRSVPLYRDRLVCVFRSGHPVARLPMTLSNFLKLRHLKVAQSPVDTRFIDNDLARRKLRRNVVLNVQHWLSAPHIVRRSDLVTAMWERMARGINADGQLAIGKLPVGPGHTTFHLYWHRRYERHAAHKWMREVIVDVCRALPEV